MNSFCNTVFVIVLQIKLVAVVVDCLAGSLNGWMDQRPFIDCLVNSL